MYISNFSKLKFYLSLAFYNLLSPLECQTERLKVFLNEFLYLFSMLGFFPLQSEVLNKILIKTKFGNYLVRDIIWDIKVVSPSFERIDINEFIKQISLSLKSGHKVVFIDAGAQFGKYTVLIGHLFKKQSKLIKILSFEPLKKNYELLCGNVHLNHLKNVKTYQKALSNKNLIQKFYYYDPQKMIVSFPTDNIIRMHTITLDSITKKMDLSKNTDVYIKLDVEGHEIEVLKGSKNMIKRCERVTLLVEDSMGYTTSKLFHFLSIHGKFIKKLSTYNSFWNLK